jgi:hypothetical protein
MTMVIHEKAPQGDFGPSPSDIEPTCAATVIRYVKAFAATTGAGSLVCLTVAVMRDEWRIALIGSTLAVLAAVAAGVLTVNALLADRQEFYRRGQLEGWHRGWNGQLPETDDPLLK